MSVRNKYEAELIDSNSFEHKPFSWIGLIIRFGHKNDDAPNFEPISKKHGDLPLTIEIDSKKLPHATQQEFEAIFSETVELVLSKVKEKYP